MTNIIISRLAFLERVGDKQTFHREMHSLLATLGHPAWVGSLPDAVALIPMLARWLKVAPLKDERHIYMLFTARRGFHALHKVAGVDVVETLEQALGAFTDPRRMKPEQRRKYALYDRIDLPFNISPAIWREANALDGTLHTIALLADEPLTPDALSRFNELVTAIADWEPVDFPFPLLAELNHAAFMSAYATVPSKFRSRKFFNSQVRHLCKKNGIQPRNVTLSPSGDDKPHILVVAENFFPGHAMHRCYAHPLESLQHDFFVTLYSDRTFRPEGLNGLAQRIVATDFDVFHLKDLVKQIQAEKPDLIFFPSVGMSPATLVLSNLRLARLQVSGIGHPVPSGSDCLDAVATLGELVDSAGTWYESVLPFDDHPLVLGPYESEIFKASAEKVRLRPERECVVFGINAAAMKLNADFLATVHEMKSKCERPSKLVFFPNFSGLNHAALAAELTRLFPDSIVWERMPYPDYLNLLSDCDILLQSFPFGGTNTTTDALALGIPVVSLDGPELHSTIDALILKTAGVAPDILADDVDQWIECALSLAHNYERRQAVAKRCREGFAQYMRSGGQGRGLADALGTLLRQDKGVGNA